ncbi:MAG: patatin-like phospholipase family protein [Parachlamydiaceae bacterium]|nr:patatin-like phospholipase family protein [Parachlamydiaceae bacterium]
MSCFTKFLLIFPVLLSLLGCCHPNRLIPKAEPDPLCPFYVPEKIRVALVLGSGGVRGMAHVGVLEELEQAGIPIDLIVGCSAGGIVGALYADNPCAEATKRALWGMRTDSMLDVDLLTCRYGLSQGGSMHKIIDNYLEAETFEELQIPLVVVASDLYTGEMVPMGSGDLVQAVRASCSMPFYFVPCNHMGRIMVDGGVVNPVPVKVARDLGADIVIAVDLSELLTNSRPSNLFDVTMRSIEIVFLWQSQVCAHRANVVIRPKTCGVGSFDENMKWQLYHAGKQAAREQIPLILELLAAQKNEEPSCAWRLVNLDCYVPEIELEARDPGAYLNRPEIGENM